MECEEMELALVEYLYGELGEEKKGVVEGRLAACATCRGECGALAGTARILRAWPDLDPGMNLVFMKRKQESRLKTFSERMFRHVRPVFAVGAAAAAVLLLLAALNTEVSYSGRGFEVKMSLLPRPEDELTSVTLQAASEHAALAPQESTLPHVEVTQLKEALLAELRKESSAVLERLVRASERRQRREWNTALAKYAHSTEQNYVLLAYALSQFSHEVDQRRQADLRLVGRGLQEVDIQARQRSERTDRSLVGLIRYAALHQRQ